MTPNQLRSLAIYRKHKNCHCADCQEARHTLSEYDRQPRVSGLKPQAPLRPMLQAST